MPWEDRGGLPNASTELGPLALLDERLFGVVSTLRSAASTGSDWVVRACDARTGAALWTDHHDTGAHDDAARLVAASGRVFAVGALSGPSGNPAFAIRA